MSGVAVSMAVAIPLLLFLGVTGLHGHQHRGYPAATRVARMRELDAQDVYDAFAQPGNTILIYSKSCPACHEMAPVLRKASALAGKTLYRFCGDGNDEIVEKLHKSYGLDAYPTLYRTGSDLSRISIYPADGPRTAKDIADFMRRDALPETAEPPK